MKETLVYTNTEDNLRHYGAVIEPDNIQIPQSVVWVHGLYQSFYVEPALSIGRQIARNGIQFVTGNNRGHDFGALLTRDGEEPLPGGGGWDKFEDTIKDIKAWIQYTLTNCNTDKVILLGHSLGTRKVTYYQYMERDPRVAGIILLSPGTTYKQPDPENYKVALELVAQGRDKDLVPWPSVGCSMSAATFLERHNTQGIMQNLFTGTEYPPVAYISVPILAITSGEEETKYGKYQEISVIEANASSCPHFTKYIFPEADHYYAPVEEAVGNVISQWIIQNCTT